MMPRLASEALFSTFAAKHHLHALLSLSIAISISSILSSLTPDKPVELIEGFIQTAGAAGLNGFVERRFRWVEVMHDQSRVATDLLKRDGCDLAVGILSEKPFGS